MFDQNPIPLVMAAQTVYRYEAVAADQGDPAGDIAVKFGAECYRNAMKCEDDESHPCRIAQFQAAEYLYRLAAQKGNIWGFIDLGYIYYYDRCEGRYFPDFRAFPPDAQAQAYCDVFDCDAQSFQCYQKAAEMGDAQSCYKVGDLLKHGRGCEKDESAAFDWYRRATQMECDDDPCVRGAAALRMAECYERGIGVPADRGAATDWYRKAVEGLGAAVKRGSWFYEQSLVGAQEGLARCQRSLS